MESKQSIIYRQYDAVAIFHKAHQNLYENKHRTIFDSQAERGTEECLFEMKHYL